VGCRRHGRGAEYLRLGQSLGSDLNGRPHVAGNGLEETGLQPGEADLYR
jgi:hypothetical protein